MTEHLQDAAKDTPTGGDTQTPSKSDLWNQLGNAVTLVAKQDQIVWAVFGVFWAANAVLLVALFTSGDLPKRPVGFVVSIVGIALSLVWLACERRAVAWLRFYEAIVKGLEQNHLHVPPSVAFTGHPETVRGMRVRPLMLACPLVSAVLWGWSVWWFMTHP
ncbi:MAG: hypothetical protein A3G20_08125 [Acidobacteria bacterium RIFCSPLOWO2_12_FULL_59_11]|nr:MAG: hypothetical protein A3G20_08125 [Acidobacteria bacterium RIFCSPLOWO2_12_FULL_59_11]